MEIAFTIPEWLMWVGGVAGGLALLLLAALGVAFICFLNDFSPFG